MHVYSCNLQQNVYILEKVQAQETKFNICMCFFFILVFTSKCWLFNLLKAHIIINVKMLHAN